MGFLAYSRQGERLRLRTLLGYPSSFPGLNPVQLLPSLLFYSRFLFARREQQQPARACQQRDHRY